LKRTTLAKRFGTRVRAARLARGWSQADFAERIGLSPNYVGIIERAEKVPGLDTVEAVARTLELNPGELLGEEPVDEAWVRQLVAMAQAVPPAKRGALLTLVGAITVALGRSDFDKGIRASDLKQIQAGADELRSAVARPPEDPKFAAVVSFLRGRSPEQLEQALRLIKALER
jgi:transcriptional regulator with XRE-family HTH domain